VADGVDLLGPRLGQNGVDEGVELLEVVLRRAGVVL
jgi:hypothetical protein